MTPPKGFESAELAARVREDSDYLEVGAVVRGVFVSLGSLPLPEFKMRVEELAAAKKKKPAASADAPDEPAS